MHVEFIGSVDLKNVLSIQKPPYGQIMHCIYIVFFTYTALTTSTQASTTLSLPLVLGGSLAGEFVFILLIMVLIASIIMLIRRKSKYVITTFLCSAILKVSSHLNEGGFLQSIYSCQ